jgi:hypothetical protein
MDDPAGVNRYLRKLIEKAHEVDLFTERVVDHTMCSEICPCYTQRPDAGVPPGESNDAQSRYRRLNEQQYIFH